MKGGSALVGSKKGENKWLFPHKKRMRGEVGGRPRGKAETQNAFLTGERRKGTDQ